MAEFSFWQMIEKTVDVSSMRRSEWAMTWLWCHLENFLIALQHYDAITAVESFAEYVPAPCTHRPSSQPSGVLVRLVTNWRTSCVEVNAIRTKKPQGGLSRNFKSRLIHVTVMNERIAYLHGALHDGYVYTGKRKGEVAVITQKNREWLERLRKIIMQMESK